MFFYHYICGDGNTQVVGGIPGKYFIIDLHFNVQFFKKRSIRVVKVNICYIDSDNLLGMPMRTGSDLNACADESEQGPDLRGARRIQEEQDRAV